MRLLRAIIGDVRDRSRWPAFGFGIICGAALYWWMVVR